VNPLEELQPVADAREALEAEAARRVRYRFHQYFLDCVPGCVVDSLEPADHIIRVGQRTPICRVLYRKHTHYFAAGGEVNADGTMRFRQRLFMAANRVGKTEAGAFEVTCHLTGLYPPWWVGRRFSEPGAWWAAGDTGETTRNILQAALWGPPEAPRTGMLPAHLIHHHSGSETMGIDTVWVKHTSGTLSSLAFKCHPAGTRVLMADGSWQAIETLRLGDQVKLADGSVCGVQQCHAYRDAPIVEIATRSGVLRATPNHPIHTERGWVDAGKIVAHDVVTIAAPTPSEGVEQPLWKVRLTALMIGDGCTRGRTPFFSCNEPPIVDMVRAVLPPDLTVVPIANTISYKISSSLHKENRLKDSLVADGLWGKKALRKFIPAWVFRLPLTQKADFLRWLFGCDGSIDPASATYGSSSLRLIHDVRLLLWAFGIHARVVEHQVGCAGKKFTAYYIALHGENRIRFAGIGKLNRPDTCTVVPRPRGPLGEVLSVQDAGVADVFCVGVDPVLHELVVEGYRVGNSYDQGRRSFQGTAKQGVWLDEEAPSAIVAECLLRLMTTEGILLVTFTPLNGLTPFVVEYLEDAVLDTGEELVAAKGGVFGDVAA
jgi:phage terminase large subunit-like protein